MGAQGPPGKDGPAGKAGVDGQRGIGIKTINISSDSTGNANLTVTLTDDKVIPLGNIKGPKGDKGDKGDKGAVEWAKLEGPDKTELAGLLNDITTKLNDQAKNGTGVFATASDFKNNLKSFIVDQLKQDAEAGSGLFATDSDFKTWLNKYQKGVSLYCIDGSCVSPDSNIKLEYAGKGGSGMYDQEVRLSTGKEGSGATQFGLGIKDGNIRTDGDISLKPGKSVYTTFVRPVNNSGITLAGDTTVAGDLTANNIKTNGRVSANTIRVGNWLLRDREGHLDFVYNNTGSEFSAGTQDRVFTMHNRSWEGGSLHADGNFYSARYNKWL